MKFQTENFNADVEGFIHDGMSDEEFFNFCGHYFFRLSILFLFRPVTSALISIPLSTFVKNTHLKNSIYNFFPIKIIISLVIETKNYFSLSFGVLVQSYKKPYRP